VHVHTITVHTLHTYTSVLLCMYCTYLIYIRGIEVVPFSDCKHRLANPMVVSPPLASWRSTTDTRSIGSFLAQSVQDNLVSIQVNPAGMWQLWGSSPPPPRSWDNRKGCYQFGRNLATYVCSRYVVYIRMHDGVGMQPCTPAPTKLHIGPGPCGMNGRQ
jgi:hypothetical protein